MLEYGFWASLGKKSSCGSVWILWFFCLCFRIFDKLLLWRLLNKIRWERFSRFVLCLVLCIGNPFWWHFRKFLIKPISCWKFTWSWHFESLDLIKSSPAVIFKKFSFTFASVCSGRKLLRISYHFFNCLSTFLTS